MTDLSGFAHQKRSAYQLALGAVDRDIKNKDGMIIVKGMVNMIEKHFKRLPYEVEKINSIRDTQFREQFPDGWHALHAKRVLEDIAALQTLQKIILSSTEDDCRLTNEIDDHIQQIIFHNQVKMELRRDKENILEHIYETICKATLEDDFEAAFVSLKIHLEKTHAIDPSFDLNLLKNIYRFRNYMESKNVKKVGLRFNVELIEAAFTFYKLNFSTIGESSKKSIYIHKICAYLGRFMPACDAQLAARGVSFVCVNGEEFKRSFDFRLKGGDYFSSAKSSDTHIRRFAAMLETAEREGLFKIIINKINDSNHVTQKVDQKVEATNGFCSIM